MVEWVQQADGIWQYLALFLISTVPMLDVFFVIPLGILLGMSPIAVGIIGFLGNFIMVLVFVLFFKQISEWRNKRRAKKGISKPSKRETRARNLWEKYGLPGFALIATSIIGTDLAALMALLFGTSRTRVVIWMGISLIFWSVFMTLASVYGFGYLDWIK